MRPRIIHFLDYHFHTAIFGWVIPDPAVVYAIMLTAGIIVFLKRCRTDDLERYHATGMVIWGSIAALLGARLFYLSQNMDLVIKDPAMLFQINGATVSFGVYIGGTLGIFLYSRKNRLNVLPYLDVLASVLGLGPLIG
ncbi:MAG TPA: prolipoprotein diacylglyceryl transferase family protein, partial [Chitinophagaceae bacterium]|nr:prolipoprotein diacylglyceryl transferase family protein [Chitinophagaceae bacterium]